MMTGRLLATLTFISVLAGCTGGEPAARVETSHECTETECAVIVAISNPGNDESQISYDFTATKTGVGVVGELQGSYSIPAGESIVLRETFRVSAKPNSMGVGTTATRGS